MQDNRSNSALTTTLAREEEKLLACVHCGLCLEACPTYTLTGDENDSPRGRIYLMRAVEEGKLPSDSVSFSRHIDRCLGCRACEPVCPAGVEYGHLLEASRAELFASGIKRGLNHRLLRVALRHVWLHPARLKFAFATARIFRDTGIAKALLKWRIAWLVSRRFEFGLALLESSAPLWPRTRLTNSALSEIRPLEGSKSSEGSAHVSLFKGCVGEGLFSRINAATERVLKTNGFAAYAPPAQVCCGALHAHAGDLEGARTLARRNIEAFSDRAEAPIITNAGGCGAMLTAYDHLLADDDVFQERARQFSARVRDVSQQLENAELKQGAALDMCSITYDASCHLLYGQHVVNEPLRLLQAIPDLKLVSLEGAERCCGSAGVYNLLESNMSQGVLKEKLSHVRKTGAEILATGNAGCQMQIGAGARLEGLALRVCHPVEVLDESYAQAGFYSESEGLSITRKSFSYKTLAIFAPLLILVGVAGFLVPVEQSLTSGAPAYNVFHIFFGITGLVVLWSQKELLVSSFNLGFGLIDLYQALASHLDLPPKQYFLWTSIDDILHVVIGLALVIIGCCGILTHRADDK